MAKIDKQTEIASVSPNGESGSTKRTRSPSTKPSKAELQKRLEDLEKQTESTFTIEQMEMISKGLFITLEQVVKLPLSEVNPEIKKGFDQSLADCANIYVGPNLGKYGPLIQLGSFTMLIVMESINLKKEQMKQQIKDKESNNNAQPTS